MMHHPKRKVVSDDPLTLFPRSLTKLYTLWLSSTYPFASKGRNLSIHFTCRLKRSHAPAIRLGSSVSICKDVWLNVPETTGGRVALVLDDNSSICPRCQISAKNCIHLERDVIVSQSVVIMDHAHAYQDTTLPIREQGITEGGTIRIGQGCWIGAGAAIVCSNGELIVGRNCVIGANAVVTRSIPPYSVVSGNPARVIKQFDPETRAWVIGSTPGRNMAELEKILGALRPHG